MKLFIFSYNIIKTIYCFILHIALATINIKVTIDKTIINVTLNFENEK